MVEIIYPENRIVVDYGDEEKLVVLGMTSRVSGKELEENITAADFNLPKEIKIVDPENEVYAIIKAVRENVAENPEEEEEAKIQIPGA